MEESTNFNSKRDRNLEAQTLGHLQIARFLAIGIAPLPLTMDRTIVERYAISRR